MIARCPGWGDGPKDWLEECHDCKRRSGPWEGQGLFPGLPPAIVVFWCEAYIPPDLIPSAGEA